MTAMQQSVRVVRPGTRREVVPSGLLGMVIFVGTEVMFFAGLISAFTISKAGAPRDAWNLPAGQVLPLASTAVNTAALFVSGALLWVAARQYRARSSAATETLLAAVFFGALFVMLQGREWVGLIAHGVTLRSSALGAFFYVIVGTHAVHAVAALAGLGVAWWRLRSGRLSYGFFLAAQTFWYFVILIWPVIYVRVYF
jgi:cytochrome c oxidase subunit III